MFDELNANGYGWIPFRAAVNTRQPKTDGSVTVADASTGRTGDDGGHGCESDMDQLQSQPRIAATKTRLVRREREARPFPFLRLQRHPPTAAFHRPTGASAGGYDPRCRPRRTLVTPWARRVLPPLPANKSPTKITRRWEAAGAGGVAVAASSAGRRPMKSA